MHQELFYSGPALVSLGDGISHACNPSFHRMHEFPSVHLSLMSKLTFLEKVFKPDGFIPFRQKTALEQQGRLSSV